MSNDDLGILISGKLDEEKTIAQINKDLKDIADKIDSIGLKIDTSKISKDIKKQLENTQKEVKKSVKALSSKSVEVDFAGIGKEGTHVVDSIKKIEQAYSGTTEKIIKNTRVKFDETTGALHEQLKDYLVTLRTVENEVKQIRLTPFETDDGKTRLKPDDIKTINTKNQELEKTLRYEQQVRRAVEQTLQKEKERTDQLKHQVKIAQERAKLDVQDFRRRFGAVITQEQDRALNNYLNNMEALTATTPNVRREMEKLGLEFKKIKSSIDTSGSHVNRFTENLREALVRVPVWMLGMTAFYAPLRGLRQATENVIMLDAQMTELKRVMDATPETYTRLMRESIELSSELGNRVKDVNQAMNEFARQGYEPETLMYLTETATIASNISELDTTEAMSSLTATMVNFNIEARNSIEIIDRINEVDNNFAISTKNISEAMEKSASTAKTFGINIDELIGLISAIGITTRESGSIIGNSLKTILSRITTLDESVGALRDVGISVRDSTGDIRSTFEILQDLAGIWNDLSKEQQQHLAVTLAGRFQLSRFLVLMQQWQTVMDVTNTSLNSQGSAMREQAEYAKSLEARLNRLSNAGVSFADAMGSAFLSDSVVIFAETIAQSVNSAEDFLREVGFLPPALALASMAIMGLSSKTRAMGAALIFGTSKMNEASLSAAGLSTNMTRAATATTILTRSLQGLASATIIGAIFAVIGFGFEKLVGYIGDSIRKKEEFREATEKSIETFKNEEKHINELVDEYERLSNINRNTEQEERYVQIQNELAQILPIVKVGEDARGNAIIANSEAVRDHIALLERQLELENQRLRSQAPMTLFDNKESISKLNEEIDELEDQYERIIEMAEEASQKASKMFEEGDRIQSRDLYQESENLMQSAEDIRQRINEKSADLNALVNESVETYRALALEIKGVTEADASWIADLAYQADLDDPIKDLEEFANQILYLRNALSGDFSLEGLTLDQLSQLESTVKNISSSIRDGTVNFDTFARKLEDIGLSAEQVNQIIGQLRYTEAELKQSAKDAGVEFSNHKPIFKDLGETIEWVTEDIYAQIEAFDGLEDAMGGVADESEDLSDQYNNLVSSIESLNGVLNELDEGNGLSARSIGTLLEKYPELLPYIEDEARLRQEITNIIDEQASAAEKKVQDAIAGIQEELLANEDYYKYLIESNAEWINELAKDYEIDLENFKSLAKAKEEVENRLLESLVKKWNEYVGAMRKATLEDMRKIVGEDGQLTEWGREWWAGLGGAGEKGRQIQREFGRYLSDAQRGMKEISTRFSEIGNIDFKSANVNLKNIGKNIRDAGRNAKKSAKDAGREYKLSAYEADTFAQALELINHALERQKRLTSEFPKHSKAYRDSLREEIKLLESKSKLLSEQAKDLDRQIKSGNIRKTGVVDAGTVYDGSGSSSSVGRYYLDNFRVTSKFGMRKHPTLGVQKMHSGIDLANGKAGDLVKALKSGKVINASYSPTAGYWVAIQQDDGVVSKYMHLQKGLKVKVGQKVSAGQVLGTVGNTGRSTGAHLHLQLERGGKAFDPMSYLEGLAAGSSDAKIKSDLSRQEAQRLADIDGAKSELLKIQGEILSIQDQIEDLYFAIIESHLAEFDHKKSVLDKKLAEIDYRQSFEDESSNAWMKQQLQREKTMREQAKIHKDSIKWLEKEKKTNKELTKAQKARLDDLLLERQKEMWNLERQILDERIKMANQLIEVYKKALDAQRNAAIASVDRILREIDEMEREADYKKNLEKEQKSRQEILDEISKWSIDDSDLAKKRIKELTEQLQELDESIDEIQSRKAIEDRRNALNKEKEAINQRYDDLINDEKAFADMRANIIKGNTKTIEKELKDFYSRIGKMTEELGNSTVKNLQRALNQMSTYITGKNFKGVTIPKFHTGGLVNAGSARDALAIVKDKEIVLNPDDTNKFLEAIKLSRELFNSLRLPKIPQLATDTGDGSVVYDFDFYFGDINGDVKEKDIVDVFERAFVKVKARGGKFIK